MNQNRRIVLLLFSLLVSLLVFSQPADTLRPVRVDTAKRYVWLFDEGAGSCFVPKQISKEQLSSGAIPMTILRGTKAFIRKNDCYGNTVIFKCKISNPAEHEQTFYFFPGFYYKYTRLFKHFPDRNYIVELKDDEDDDMYHARKISFAPGEECTLFFVAQAARTNNLLFQPMLVTSEYFPLYKNLLHYDATGGVAIGYVTTGILLLMIFFSLVNYVQSYRKEFLYFCGFAIFIGLLFFFKAYDYHKLSGFPAIEEELIDFLFQLAGHLFFLLFTIKFLETGAKFPKIHNILIASVLLITGSFILFSLSYFLNLPYNYLAFIEVSTKYALIGLGIFFVVIGFINYKDKLFRYLLYGNIALLITGMISLVMSQYKLASNGDFAFLTHSLFYYELGIVLELGFFLMGLVYKNYRELAAEIIEQERLKALNEKSELEKQLAVYTAQQEERNRISADMHDELGAGMTAIRLMSEIAIAKTSSAPVTEVQKISDTANDMVSKLNAIVWSMSTSNDTLINLTSYIKRYAYDYFENMQVRLKVEVPENIDDRELSGEKRRNIFLCVKESLNNILKHSGATEVIISFSISDHLEIKIKDNGRGIDPDQMREFGNGLKNMKKRMEKIAGSFSMVNNHGLETTLTVSLN